MPAFFRICDKFKPIYDWTYKIMLFLCKLLLIGDILITSWAVLGRYVPFISDPHWSEEVVLTLMVYLAVFSATMAIRKRSHIRMTSFDKYLPRKLLMASDLLADLAVMALGVVLIIYGMKFCNSPLSIRGRYASIPTLSKIWQYIPIPIAGFSMVIFELEQVILHIRAFFEPEAEEKKDTEGETNFDEKGAADA